MKLSSKSAKIYVPGHAGMVGSAIVDRLQEDGYSNLVTAAREELDLRNQSATRAYIENEEPDIVILAAARVGGILANDRYPADFIYDNLAIASNVIHAAHRAGVQRLIFLGSSCIYPKYSPQPMKEEYLLTGPLEPTNDAYAIAKIAGIKLCQAYSEQYDCDFFTLMPTNLYGPRDNFDLETSHVLPALLRKFHEAKVSGAAQKEPSVTVWGSGEVRREFLHVGDLADAVLHVLKLPEARIHAVAPDRMLNVGVGEDISINGLAELIKDVAGSNAHIEHDRSKPDGTPRKLLDVSRLRELGWEAQTSLRTGIEQTYRWYLDHVETASVRN